MVFKKNKKVFSFGIILLFLFVLPISFNGDLFLASAQTMSWWSPANWLPLILIGIQKLLGMFLDAGISLITIAIDAELLNKMLNGKAVEESWRSVRDLCNLGFILTLLFSAFATIFQVKKYHIKNIILNVVLVALLINFSYPIVRFVADLGNVPMYYLAETLFGKSKTGSVLAEESNIICALIPHYGGREGCGKSALEIAGENETSGLLASIIMLFILGITMFVIAALFIVRLIGLCILIIFSPIGFIGLAVPPLKKYADEYWGNLVKYTIFGPIMLLTIAISTKLMHAFNEYGSHMDNFGGAIIKFSVPLIILWMGINMSMKIGVAGSDVAMSFGKKWGGRLGRFGLRWGTPYGYIAATLRQRGYPGAFREIRQYYQKKGFRGMGGSQNREYNEQLKKAWLLGGTTGRDAAVRDYRRKQISEIQEEQKKNNISEATLLNNLRNNSSSNELKVASARSLAERGLLSNPKALSDTLQNIAFSPEDVQHVLQKADRKALGSLSGENYLDIQTALKSEGNRRAAESYTGNGSEQITTSLEKIKTVLDGRLKEEGNILARIEAADRAIAHNQTVSKGDDTQTILNGMNADDLAKQKSAFFQNPSVQNHVANLEKDERSGGKQVFTQFVNKASPDKLQELGLSSQRQQQKQSSFQESLRKRAERQDIQNRAGNRR